MSLQSNLFVTAGALVGVILLTVIVTLCVSRDTERERGRDIHSTSVGGNVPGFQSSGQARCVLGGRRAANSGCTAAG